LIAFVAGQSSVRSAAPNRKIHALHGGMPELLAPHPATEHNTNSSGTPATNALLASDHRPFTSAVGHQVAEGVGCGPDGTPTTTQPVACVQPDFHSIGRLSGDGMVGGRSGGSAIDTVGRGGSFGPQVPNGGNPPSAGGK
jgi:hypothetical protein